MSKSNAIIASYLGTMIFASLLFISAGKLYYWQGLLFLLLSIIGTTLNHLLLPKHSTLNEERINKTHGGVPWDKTLLMLYFLISLCAFIIAGLDSGRFYWTNNVPLFLTITGSITTFAGQLIFAFSKRENTFFSSTVQIQTEKKHTVCTTGLYKYVRHPGYLGMSISMISFPLVLDSLLSFIPAVMCVIILVMRTNKEDSYLKAKLDGYSVYSEKTKWKLIPFFF